MTDNFGSGVSLTLNALMRQFQAIVFQEGKPPLDSELNLLSQVHSERIRETVSSLMPSGFLFNPNKNKDDYECLKEVSNVFYLGKTRPNETNAPIVANVNGWFLPIAGTDNSVDLRNLVKLNPPPLVGTRTDLVFLEVWRSLISPNPATANKSSANSIYKYGNTKFGGTQLPDDLNHPDFTFETSKRIQIQYRIRVFGSGLSGVNLDQNPDGLGDIAILGQGNATNPVIGYPFINVRESEGDPSLWRAGDGVSSNGLGTIDGYVYAIPICAIFRRNVDPFSSINLSGNPNQNGSFERTPSTRTLVDPLSGAKILSTLTLNQNLAWNATGVANVSGLVDSGFDDPLHNFANVFLKIDDEIIEISSLDTVGGTITIANRGRAGTDPTTHLLGTKIEFYNSRPDSLYADEIALSDILDLRKAVAPSWDYSQLLQNGLISLFKNQIQSTWKQSGSGSTEGVSVIEVDALFADGSTPNPNETEALDGLDGIRTIFSDAATMQHDVTILLDNNAALANGFTTSQFDATTVWDVGADFRPTGFINNEGATGEFRDGSVIFLHLGGQTGSEGARSTFRDGNTRAVRFVSPQEYYKDLNTFPTEKQSPVSLRFLKEPRCNPTTFGHLGADNQAGSLYPWPEGLGVLGTENFTHPIAFLGGLLHPSFQFSINPTTDLLDGGQREIDLGIDFDVLGDYYSLDSNGNFENNPSNVAFPLYHGNDTLYGLLTNNGQDLSGFSSQVYIVMYGDDDTGSRSNNGLFWVVGAGTVGYTRGVAANSTSVIVIPVCTHFTSFNTASGGTLTAEIRSFKTHVKDGNGSTTGPSAAAIVLTDLAGIRNHPWNLVNGDNQQSKMVINTTLLYSQGRSAFARNPDTLLTTAIKNPTTIYLKQALSARDGNFPTDAGISDSEIYWEGKQIQLWNRLPSKGLGEQYAAHPYPSETLPSKNHGGSVVGFSEQDRESELFVDLGSKTIMFRPFQDKEMTLQSAPSGANPSLIGTTTYTGALLTGSPKDAATIFTASKTLGFPIPPEYMPRFGRQDIPYYKDVAIPLGTGQFLEGINHLFKDQTDETKNVFYVIGGEDNVSLGAEVKPLFFQTGIGVYGGFGTSIGVVPNKPTYNARRTAIVTNGDVRKKLDSVVSSDFGRGLSGIQLPPYLGIARLYGVYDRADYIAKGGNTFAADRVTPIGGGAVNLLKTDATKQTLFILQDGAKDLTEQDDDHTYIIPKEAIDISKSPNWVAGMEFDDFDYVVECVVFGFSKGFINQNNFVLVRRNAGDGTALSDAGDYELAAINMVIPSAAPLNQQLYNSHKRTVYQGDPFGSRAGSTHTRTDYEHRYGQFSSLDADEVKTPLPKDLSDIQTPNLRSFEVLASANFYTTHGTGKIGGVVWQGTPLDIGHQKENKERTEGLLLEQQKVRAFTSFDRNKGNRAWVEFQFTEEYDTTSVTAPSLDEIELRFKNTRNLGGFSETLIGYLYNNISYNPANPDHFVIATPFRETATLDFPSVAADGFENLTVTIDGIRSNSIIVVNAPSLEAGLTVDAFCTSDNTVTIRCRNTTGAPIDPVSQNFLIKVVDDGRTVSLGSMNQSDYVAQTARNIARTINTHPILKNHFIATAIGSSVRIETILADKADPFYSLEVFAPNTITGSSFRLRTENQNDKFLTPSKVFFKGGEAYTSNAGDGNSALSLTGISERLPLGILAQDSDFLYENLLRDNSSSLKVLPASAGVINQILPLASTGKEFERFLDAPSTLIAMSDGDILKYDAFDASLNPTGTKKFRIFRGGGSVFLLSGETAGGVLDWNVEGLSEVLKPVLKGGVIVGKALLVRNFPEEAFSPARETSAGDEIQLVILTYAHYGNGNSVEEGLKLQGIISSTGFGEGYAAADRYRLNGHPMLKSNTRVTRDPSSVELALYTEDENKPL